MKQIITSAAIIFFFHFASAQNVGINTTAPQAYGHGGTNRVLELKNDAGTGADFQSHLILSTNGTSGSLGTLTWAAPNIPGTEKRSALIANIFETANATRLAFYTRAEAGSVTERFSINGNGNVGIGTTTPGFPINFANTTGDKISLYGNTGNHFGLGIQSSLLQIHTDIAGSNIAFGYGSSAAFNERMRIINSGSEGLDLKGRVLLRNGTSPLDINYAPGIWMYKADNSAALGFMGVQNNQNMGFYGGPGGWGFTYDAINSRVGIGNNNPNAPLAFPPVLGKKITLYPGATGDVGFGVAGNRLQIYSDNPNADVAIGYDAAGTFNERFAVKPNGALAINGNTGTAGQVLQTNGNAATATWSSASNWLFNNSYLMSQSGGSIIVPRNTSSPIPGLTFSDLSITVSTNSKLIVSFKADLGSIACGTCGQTFPTIEIKINRNGSLYTNIIDGTYVYYGTTSTFNTGIEMLNVTPGTYTFSVTAYSGSGTDLNVFRSKFFIVALPQ